MSSLDARLPDLIQVRQRTAATTGPPPVTANAARLIRVRRRFVAEVPAA